MWVFWGTKVAGRPEKALFMWLVVGTGLWLGPQIFIGGVSTHLIRLPHSWTVGFQEEKFKEAESRNASLHSLCLAIFYHILLVAVTGPA